MKSIAAKIIGKCILILLSGGVIGTLLLTLAFLVPVNTKNAMSSYEVLDMEGWYPAMPVLSRSLDTHFHSYLPGVLDDHTDSIMLYTAMDNSGENPLYRAMNMHDANAGGGYQRYWHGYVALLRPLLFFFSYSEIRVLNCFLQLLLVFALIYHITQKKGWAYGLLMFTSYVLLMPLALPLALQYTWVFYIATVSCFIFLKHQVYFETNSRYVYFFLLVGMLTSYMDLLTYPLFTWGLPILWWTIMSQSETPKLTCCKRIITSGICWIVGYAVMWISKWVYASLILGQDIIGDAFNQAIYRVGSSAEAKMSLFNRLEAIYFNWKHYEYSLYAIILLIWLVWFIYRAIRYGLQTSLKCYAYAVIACSSIVWYFVLANHTLGHHLFTYRIFNISIIAILALLLESTPTITLPVSHRARIRTIIGLCFITVLSGAMSLFAREDLFAHNGIVATQNYTLDPEYHVEAYFTPTFSHITEILIGIETTDTEGYCELSILSESDILYQHKIPLSNFNQTSYTNLDVDWKLSTDKTYVLQLAIKDNVDKAYLVVTVPEQQPLNEYQNLKINGIEIDGQPMSGFNYSARPSSKLTLLFLTMTWIGIFSAVGIVIYTTKKIFCKQRTKE